MSTTTFPPKGNVNSRAGTDKFLAFAEQNGSQLPRLFELMKSRPGKVENGKFVFTTPISIEVDANHMTIEPSARKRKLSKYYRPVFQIPSRDLDDDKASADALATLIGCMHLRDLVRECNNMERRGIRANMKLFSGMMLIFKYMEFAAVQLHKNERDGIYTL